MQFVVEAPKSLPEGKHRGEITRVDYRFEPYEYTDIYVKTKGKEGEIELKYGCPSKVTPQTKLGKLLKAFGADLKPGNKVDPEKILVGKKCEFMTINEETERGTFARIVDGSLKPLK